MAGIQHALHELPLGDVAGAGLPLDRLPLPEGVVLLHKQAAGENLAGGGQHLVRNTHRIPPALLPQWISPGPQGAVPLDHDEGLRILDDGGHPLHQGHKVGNVGAVIGPRQQAARLACSPPKGSLPVDGIGGPLAGIDRRHVRQELRNAAVPLQLHQGAVIQDGEAVRQGGDRHLGHRQRPVGGLLCRRQRGERQLIARYSGSHIIPVLGQHQEAVQVAGDLRRLQINPKRLGGIVVPQKACSGPVAVAPVKNLADIGYCGGVRQLDGLSGPVRDFGQVQLPLRREDLKLFRAARRCVSYPLAEQLRLRAAAPQPNSVQFPAGGDGIAALPNQADAVHNVLGRVVRAILGKRTVP